MKALNCKGGITFYPCKEFDSSQCKLIFNWIAIKIRRDWLGCVVYLLILKLWTLDSVLLAPVNLKDISHNWNLGRHLTYPANSDLIGGSRGQAPSKLELTDSEKQEIITYLFKYGYVAYADRGHKEGIFLGGETTDAGHLLDDALSVFLQMHDLDTMLNKTIDESEPEKSPYADNEETVGKLKSFKNLLAYCRRPRCSNSDLPQHKIKIFDHNSLEADNGAGASRLFKWLDSVRNNRKKKKEHPPFPANKFTNSRYLSKHQTWRLMNRVLNESYNENFDRIRATLHKSFLTWTKYAPLSFSEIPRENKGPVHHEVYFVTDSHKVSSWWPTKCIIELGEQSTDTAHGFFPHYGGSLHINSNREWYHHYLGEGNKLNLWQTATHEIGHTIGLEHIPSRMKKWNGEFVQIGPQIMDPSYHESVPEGELGEYDAIAIQALYGKYGGGKKGWHRDTDPYDMEIGLLPRPISHRDENVKYSYSMPLVYEDDNQDQEKENRLLRGENGMLRRQGERLETDYRINFEVPDDLSEWVKAFDTKNLR